MLQLVMAATFLERQDLTDFQYQAAHELFVPEGTIVTPQEMRSFVLATYGKASIDRHEDLDSLLIGDLFRFLPKGESELVSLCDGFSIGGMAEQKIEKVKTETDMQIEWALGRAATVPDANPMLAAGSFLAKESVAGERRKTGRPYYTHVFRVAAMGFYIARTLEAKGLRDDPELTEAEILLRLHHDSPEETMPAGKHYNPLREGHFSPLLILRLMDKFDNPYARPVADALRYITHLKSKEMAWMRQYPDYVRERVMKNLFAIMAKQDDMFDNRNNEPKPVTSLADTQTQRDKFAQYDELTPELQTAAEELAPTEADVIWISGADKIRRRIKPGLQRDKTKPLYHFIYHNAA